MLEELSMSGTEKEESSMSETELGIIKYVKNKIGRIKVCQEQK